MMNLFTGNTPKLLLCSVVFTQMLCLSAHAASDDEAWHFRLAPYAWLAGMDGTVATLPGLPPADIKLDFWDDIIDDIDGALMLVGEARKGCYGAFMDVAYVDIESDAKTPGPLFSSVISTSESWMVSAAGFYRLYDEPGAFVDVLAGIRYWSVDSTLELRPGLLPGREVSNKEDWVDPLVGLKGQAPLGESRFFVSGGAVIGGFGAGADFMWDVNINLGYRWSETFATTLGYRYLDVDYEEDDFLYDIAQQGPVLGLSWRF